MFGYLTSFIYSEQEQSNVDHILSTLWYCKKSDRIMQLVNKMTDKNSKVPSLFMEQLTENKVNVFTHKIIKEMMTTYNAPKWGVCKQVADYLSDDTPCIASACAIAIGTEKVKWNKEFYHKVRVLKNMEMGEWRKYLKEMRKQENYLPIQKSEPKKYTIGLFNEPLHCPVINTSDQDVPILSLYKGKMYKNKHCRSPIEIPLDIAMTQDDLNMFVKEQKDEDLVIIAKSVGKNVVPPEGVYICFIEDTESYKERIYPLIKNNEYNSIERFFDII